MKLFGQYLKEYQSWIIVWMSTFLIWLFIFYVYRLSFDAFIYGSLIQLLIFLIILGVNLVHYHQKHRLLESFKTEANVPYIFETQETSLHGQDYLEILKVMDTLRKQSIEQTDEMIKSNQDYFTLWVHQMKLPIAALKLCLESETIDRQESRTQLSKIDQYTDMVLAYLRMTSQQTDYVFHQYDLDGLIHQSIQRFSLEFIHKKIRLHFAKTHQKILTDEKWFVFVLEQILSNAIKYSENGSTIEIYAHDHDLIIEDHGKGIDPSDIQRVFEKGYTGINGRLDKKASGLGLYLCKEICRQLSCTIDIESKINQGTKVILHIEHEDLMPE